MTDPVLLGGNLAMLVAAAELVRRGRRVTLATDGRPPGGHFAGVTLDGHHFDIGMVLLEQRVGAPPDAALGSYDPQRRNDWTRFSRRAAAWLEGELALVRTPTPECLLEGAVWPDFLIANRLEALVGRRAPPPPPLPRDDPRHAARKGEDGPFDAMTYAEAAERHHGAALHADCIEPFVRKVTGVGSASLLARYHRAAWAPLFYPDTVRDALDGRLGGLPEYPFWAAAEGFTGQLVRGLLAKLAAAPLATVLAAPVTALRRTGAGWMLTVGDAPPRRSDRLALGVAAERGHALLGLPEPPVLPAADVALLFALVREEAIGRPAGCLLVVDEAYAAYRVSDQDALAARSPAWHRVVVEANPALVARRHPGVELATALTAELRALLAVREPDGVRPLRARTAARALVLPTATAVAAGTAGHDALRDAAPGVPLSGALLGYGVASMNDQIVQGLALAEALA